MATREGRGPQRKALKVDIAALTPDEIAAINATRPPSEKLTPPEERCGALLKPDPNRKDQTRTTCRNRAGEGTSHPGWGNCKFHGGTTRAGVKSAARDYGRDLIQRQKDKFGGDGSLLAITAEEALIEEVRRSVAMVRFLEEQIGLWQLVDDPEGLPALGGLPTLIDETSKGAATFTDQREWLMLYREERKHAAQVSALAIQAGLAERMVKIAESQGEVLASVIRAVLDALLLSPEQHALVPRVVPTIIRQVTSGQPVILPDTA